MIMVIVLKLEQIGVFYSAVEFGFTVQWSLVLQCSGVWFYSAVQFDFTVQCKVGRKAGNTHISQDSGKY